MSNLVQRAYETSRGWLALGHEHSESPLAWIVRDRQNPNVYDANFAAMVRAESEPEIDALLARCNTYSRASTTSTALFSRLGQVKTGVGQDTPKRRYSSMSFRPLCLQHGYLKHISPRK